MFSSVDEYIGVQWKMYTKVTWGKRKFSYNKLYQFTLPWNWLRRPVYISKTTLDRRLSITSKSFNNLDYFFQTSMKRIVYASHQSYLVCKKTERSSYIITLNLPYYSNKLYGLFLARNLNTCSYCSFITCFLILKHSKKKKTVTNG